MCVHHLIRNPNCQQHLHYLQTKPEAHLAQINVAGELVGVMATAYMPMLINS